MTTTKTTKTTTLRSMIVSLGLALGACGATHLGPDTNVAHRAAFAAQRDSQPAREPVFGADDARGTMAARRGDKVKHGGGAGGVAAAAGGLLPAALLGGGAGGAGGSGGGAWQGAQGKMSLEAK